MTDIMFIPCLQWPKPKVKKELEEDEFGEEPKKSHKKRPREYDPIVDGKRNYTSFKVFFVCQFVCSLTLLKRRNDGLKFLKKFSCGVQMGLILKIWIWLTVRRNTENIHLHLLLLSFFLSDMRPLRNLNYS